MVDYPNFATPIPIMCNTTQIMQPGLTSTSGNILSIKINGFWEKCSYTYTQIVQFTLQHQLVALAGKLNSKIFKNALTLHILFSGHCWDAELPKAGFLDAEEHLQNHQNILNNSRIVF